MTIKRVSRKKKVRRKSKNKSLRGGSVLDYSGNTPADWSAAAASSSYRRRAISELNLYNAAKVGNIDMVTKLLATGADPNDPKLVNVDDRGQSPLCVASRHGHVEVVKMLLDAGADPNVKKTTADGATPLHIVAQNGNVDVLKLLVAKGADPNQATDVGGATPVYIAAQQGHIGVVKELIAMGADPNKERTDTGTTPVFIAAQQGHVDVVKALLENGADPNKTKTDNGETPVLIAADRGYLDIVEALLANGADPNKATTDDGSTPVLIAADRGYLDIVEALLANGADPNKDATDDGSTPLSVAVDRKIRTQQPRRTKELVRMLLAHGADPRDVFFKAIKETDIYIFTLLLDEDVSLEMKDRTGKTPLHLVAIHGGIEILNKLLTKGIDINVRNNDKVTPLHYAAYYGHKNVVDILLEAGATIDLEDDQGYKPVDYAIEKNHVDVIDLLAKKGAFLKDIEFAKLSGDMFNLNDLLENNYRFFVKSQNEIDGNFISIDKIYTLIFSSNNPLCKEISKVPFFIGDETGIPINRISLSKKYRYNVLFRTNKEYEKINIGREIYYACDTEGCDTEDRDLFSRDKTTGEYKYVGKESTIINLLPCELFDEDCHSCAKSRKCKYKKYNPKQKRKVGKSGKCVLKTYKASNNSLYIKNNHTKCDRRNNRRNDGGGGAPAPRRTRNP